MRTFVCLFVSPLINYGQFQVPEPTQPQEETEEEKQFRDLFKQISGPASQLIKMIDLIRILDGLLAECMLFM